MGCKKKVDNFFYTHKCVLQIVISKAEYCKVGRKKIELYLFLFIFFDVARRRLLNFEAKPVFTCNLGKFVPAFREYLASKPARPGSTSLSDHIGKYSPPGQGQDL